MARRQADPKVDRRKFLTGVVAGSKLAPNPMPLEALTAFVRNTNGAMPPYQKGILSDADLADIHAYLLSLPKVPDPKSIPLLNP